MLIIRLQRTGKKNQADFRIVLAEKTAAAGKKCVEILGSYNPVKKNFKVKEERIKYWISQRVEMSPTLHNLLVTNKLLEGSKVQAFKIKKKKEPAQVPKAQQQAPVTDQPAASVPETPPQASAEPVAQAEEKPAETPAQ